MFRLTGLLKRGVPIALLAATLAAAGCTWRSANVDPVPFAPRGVPTSRTAMSLGDALDYFGRWRGAGNVELARESAELDPALRDESAQLRQAMVLALLRRNGDLPRASVLLDGLLKSDSAQARAVRPLTLLLADQVAAQRRLEAETERLSHLVRDEQRRSAQLSGQLRSLKAIEIGQPSRVPPVSAVSSVREAQR